MEETSENTAPEAPLVAAGPRPVAWGRPMLFVALFALGILVGALVTWVGSPGSSATKSAARERLITPSVKATQSVVASSPVAAKPAVEPVTLSGSVADEFGRALTEAIILVGRDLPHVSPNSEKPEVGELGVTKGPVPAIPDTTTMTPPRDAATARSDQDGKFSISGVEPGNVQVYVSQPGYEPTTLALAGLRPGETRDKLYIVLRTPVEAIPVEPIAPLDPNLARIAGVVIDVLGRPVSGALVETDEGEASTQTGADGAFELIGVVPGALRVVASDDTAGQGESPEVRARAGELLPGIRLHLPGRHEPRPGQAEAPAPRAPSSQAAASAPPFAAQPVRAAKPQATPAPLLLAGVALEQGPNSVLVNIVDQNSAASRGGLLAGDTLLRVDNEPVLSASQGRGMLRDPTGRVARVQVLRGNKRVNLRWKRPGVRYVTVPLPPDPSEQP